MKRCDWVTNEEIYIKYHDEEWGVPIYDEQMLFEFLILEGAQAGLSWITILKKRENYRKAFDNFDVKKVANYNEEKIEELLNNTGIVRNKLKIRAAINNANRYIEIQKEFGSFKNYIWSFANEKQIKNKWKNIKEVPTRTELSDKISNDLKKRGFKFVGTTIIYAYLQAIGVVNDHLITCHCYKK